MPIRRSGRRSGARKSYTDDPFQAIGLEESEDEENTKRSVDPSGKEKGKAKKRKRESDDEFDEDVAAESNEDDDEPIENEASQSDEPAQEEEEEGAPAQSVIVNRSSAAGGNRTSRYRERKGDGSLRFLPQETHSRGVFNPSEHVSKSMHIKLSFGLDDRDLLAVVNARSRFTTGIDSIFPTRASLDKEPTATSYGPGNTHGVYAADLEREATAGWDWYYDNEHGSNFRKKQRLENIEEKQAHEKFLFKPRKNTLKVIYGPGDAPTSTQLPHHGSINFANAWKNRDETHKIGKKDTTKKKGKRKAASEAPDNEIAENEASMEETRRKNRYGWFINVSGKIQAMSWAPNESGMTQYLAVSVPIDSEQEQQYNPPGPPTVSPAFSPSPPYPGAIQIWSVDAEERQDYITKTLDVEQKPKLRLVLCMEFGHIRKLNWCSIPRKKREEDENDNARSLGLLACVFSDGHTRILDVKVNKKSETTEYLYVHSAAFTAMPSPTVSSCMAWLSPTDIIVGCANGSVSVYNILTCDTSRPDNAPIPYLNFPVHMTYISKIQTGYPQHPQLISTVSMDGNTRLTSLGDPSKDVVDTQRQRMGTTHISYNPFLQAFISSDENDFVRGLSVRRFYTSTSVGRLPSTVSAIANGSRWHPSTLVGSTEGSVFILNALRRFMHSKEPHFHARWFLHEWARGKEDETPDTVRFTDEVEVEGLNLTRATRGDGKVVNGVMGITVYDEPQHVLALEWNPSQHCAGWVAAGMGSGLIRVEDLAMFH